MLDDVPDVIEAALTLVRWWVAPSIVSDGALATTTTVAAAATALYHVALMGSTPCDLLLSRGAVESLVTALKPRTCSWSATHTGDEGDQEEGSSSSGGVSQETLHGAISRVEHSTFLRAWVPALRVLRLLCEHTRGVVPVGGSDPLDDAALREPEPRVSADMQTASATLRLVEAGGVDIVAPLLNCALAHIAVEAPPKRRKLHKPTSQEQHLPLEQVYLHSVVRELCVVTYLVMTTGPLSMRAHHQALATPRRVVPHVARALRRFAQQPVLYTAACQALTALVAGTSEAAANNKCQCCGVAMTVASTWLTAAPPLPGPVRQQAATASDVAAAEEAEAEEEDGSATQRRLDDMAAVHHRNAILTARGNAHRGVQALSIRLLAAVAARNPAHQAHLLQNECVGDVLQLLQVVSASGVRARAAADSAQREAQRAHEHAVAVRAQRRADARALAEAIAAANAMKAAALAELDGADMTTTESHSEAPGVTVQQGQQEKGDAESANDGDVSDDEAITAAQYARDAAARARLVAHSVLEVEHECCRLLCTLAGTATRHFPPIAASMVHGGGLAIIARVLQRVASGNMEQDGVTRGVPARTRRVYANTSVAPEARPLSHAARHEVLYLALRALHELTDRSGLGGGDPFTSQQVLQAGEPLSPVRPPSRLREAGEQQRPHHLSDIPRPGTSNTLRRQRAQRVQAALDAQSAASRLGAARLIVAAVCAFAQDKTMQRWVAGLLLLLCVGLQLSSRGLSLATGVGVWRWRVYQRQICPTPVQLGEAMPTPTEVALQMHMQVPALRQPGW